MKDSLVLTLLFAVGMIFAGLSGLIPVLVIDAGFGSYCLIRYLADRRRERRHGRNVA